MKVNDRETNTWKESVNVLMDQFFPATSMKGVSPVDNDENKNDRCFGWDEVNEAVRMLKLRKATGMDGVSAEMFRVVWRAIPEWVKIMYDVCLSTNTFPSMWKTARVIVLLKSPERVRSDPSSYRPICLLSVCAKVLERMMVNRLEKKMNGRMNGAQYGFVRGRSTESAWWRMIEYVSEYECKYVLGVFVDFSGAFDNLEWQRVIEKLREIECEEIGLWMSYFRERKVCMSGVNDIVWKNVERGCPQGSVCGPFIWNLMMDGLLWRLAHYECKCVAYADDLCILVQGRNRVDVERKGTECMRMVYEWGENVGVRVNEKKTVVMLLKGSLADTRQPCVRVNGKLIKYVKRICYLGVWMSERMNFKVHLSRVRDKIVNIVGCMRRVLRCEW